MERSDRAAVRERSGRKWGNMVEPWGKWVKGRVRGDPEPMVGRDGRKELSPARVGTSGHSLRSLPPRHQPATTTLPTVHSSLAHSCPTYAISYHNLCLHYIPTQIMKENSWLNM